MDDKKTTKINDPLGLEALDKVIQRLQALKSESSKVPTGTTRFVLVVDQLDQCFKNTQQKYELLKDRYSLIKRSNAALCDELVWLRDQLDDLTSHEDKT